MDVEIKARFSSRTRSVPLLLFCFISVLASKAQAQTVVSAVINFTEVHDRVFPFQQQTFTQTRLSFQLSTKGQVTESEHIAGIGGHRQLNLTKTMRIGSENESGKWHVVGEHQLVNVVDNISYRRAVLVTINGSQCTAQVAYRFKPGFNDYRYHRLETGEFAIATSLNAIDVDCSLQ